MNLESFENRKTLLAASGTFLVVLSVVAYGLPMYEAQGTCYVEESRCHGIPFDSCLGISSEETRFVPGEECEVLGNITSECNRIGEKIAEENSGSIGTRWSSVARVEGQTCERWREVYGINLTSY